MMPTLPRKKDNGIRFPLTKKRNKSRATVHFSPSICRILCVQFSFMALPPVVWYRGLMTGWRRNHNSCRFTINGIYMSEVGAQQVAFLGVQSLNLGSHGLAAVATLT
jgi:hypothetical protein